MYLLIVMLGHEIQKLLTSLFMPLSRMKILEKISFSNTMEMEFYILQISSMIREEKKEDKEM